MIRLEWDIWANQERWGSKVTRGMLVYLVLLGRRGNQDHRVKLVRWGHKDKLGPQDQRDFPGTLDYRGLTDHLDRRVCKVPEDP